MLRLRSVTAARSSTQVPRWLAAIAIGALLAGCTDQSLVEPANRATGSASLAAAPSSSSPFHPNSQKYADKGSKPASGRSGSAAMQLRALLGKDGETTIDVSTGTIDGIAGRGQLSKVQLKTSDYRGRAAGTENFNNLSSGAWNRVTAGLLQDDSIQVQGNIRGIDGNRTDVVTLTTAVKKRPDVRVTAVTSPLTAWVNTPVTISATLDEANGDVGARADCVLLVDGIQVDHADGIWIDAGDAVSCVFTRTFDTKTTHALEVRAVNVVPGDWDASNNSATASITITDPIVAMTWQSSIWHDGIWAHDTWFESNGYCGSNVTGYCSVSSYGHDTTRTSTTDVFLFSAQSANYGAQFPTTLSFSASSGGFSIMAFDLPITPGPDGCAAVLDPTTGASGTVCLQGGNVQAQFQRSAGSATYTSYETSTYRVWEPVECESYGYNAFTHTTYVTGYYQCGTDFEEYPEYWTVTGSSGDPSLLFGYDGSTITTSLALTAPQNFQFIAGGSYATSGSSVASFGNYPSSCTYYFGNPVSCRQGQTNSVETTISGSGHGP